MFFKVFEILCRLRKCSQKTDEIFFEFEINAFELVSLDSRALF